MSALRQQWSRRAVLTALGTVLAGGLAGCMYAGPFPVPKSAEPKEAPQPKTQERRVDEPAAAALKLDVIYYQRIFVPLGAELTVAVVDAKGRKASGAITTSTAQPYRIEVPLGNATSGPLAVTVTLKSPAGHTLTGSKALASVPSAYTEFVISN